MSALNDNLWRIKTHCDEYNNKKLDYCVINMNNTIIIYNFTAVIRVKV